MLRLHWLVVLCTKDTAHRQRGVYIRSDTANRGELTPFVKQIVKFEYYEIF